MRPARHCMSWAKANFHLFKEICEIAMRKLISQSMIVGFMYAACGRQCWSCRISLVDYTLLRPLQLKRILTCLH